MALNCPMSQKKMGNQALEPIAAPGPLRRSFSLHLFQAVIFFFFTAKNFVHAAGAVALQIQRAIRKADFPEFFIDVVHEVQIKEFAPFGFRHFNPCRIIMIMHLSKTEPAEE